MPLDIQNRAKSNLDEMAETRVDIASPAIF
jgi:hypothetical protein